MPRNSSGTYSLYTPGNPVVTSTVISSTWANNTLADIASALTDSLSRTGDGGMQAPLELDNGAVGAPGMTWAAETTSGWYRASAGNFRFSISAADVLTLTAGGLVSGAATGGAQGAGTINSKGLYVDGVALANAAGANPSTSVGLTATNGVATTFMRSDAAPALSQSIAPTWTGVHTFAGPAPGIRIPDGNTAVSTPGLCFANDTDTGIARPSANAMNIVLGGSNSYLFSQTDFSTAGTLSPGGVVLGPGGTNSAPTFSFATDSNTGFYLGAADDPWMALGGTGYPVGYRGMPARTITTSDSTAATDNGRGVLFTGAGSQTFTVDSDFGVAEYMMVIMNGGTGSLSIAESLSGTMTWLNGSGTLSTGSRTLAIGGMCTIWMVDANNAYIWGTGLS